MESQLFTLSKIFTERLFRIPDYQRGYAWTEAQLKAFWNDIQQLEGDTNHYTGVLTLETVTKSQSNRWADDGWIIDSKKYEPLFVVDGQQRLTTSIILIQAILETVPEDGKLNFTSKKDIQKKYIFDSKDEGVSRSYIFGYDIDNPSYEFLKVKIFNEYSSSNKSEETIYTNNLEQAKKFFSDKIKEMPLTEIEALFRKVTQNLLFNIFSISDEVDVCVAFETMNNRGKPLSELELLKNRLIYLSLKIEQSAEERAALRKTINDCWKSIYHNLGRNKARPLDDDLFLSSHYFLYFQETESGENEDASLWVRQQYRNGLKDRRNSYTKLLEEVFVAKRVTSQDGERPELELSEIYAYVSALQPAVEEWYKLFNPSSLSEQNVLRPWLDKLDRLQNPEQLPFKLAVLLAKGSDSDKVEVFKRLESHEFVTGLLKYKYYRYTLSDPFLKEAIQLYRGEIDAKQLVKVISESTAKIVNSKSFLAEVRKEFRTHGFYVWDNIRYFLYEYNLHLQERSKTERKKLDWESFVERRADHRTVEHVFPQQARVQYWTSRFSGCSQAQRRSLINSLGNLAPLSKAKNSSLSNKSFTDKVRGSKDEVVGFAYGCYVENEIADEKEWTKEVILKRGLKLLAFMEKRWSIDLGTLEDKINMLGLDFLDKPQR